VWAGRRLHDDGRAAAIVVALEYLKGEFDNAGITSSGLQPFLDLFSADDAQVFSFRSGDWATGKARDRSAVSDFGGRHSKHPIFTTTPPSPDHDRPDQPCVEARGAGRSIKGRPWRAGGRTLGRLV